MQKSCLQNVIDNQLSHVTTFMGAPSTWGQLLRTIDVRPRQLSCIATSVQGIIAACGDIVNIYNTITFGLRQSLHTPENVTKILCSSSGSTLFFAHSSSVTMWDVQTGGHIHTFTMGSEIQDISISTTGDYIVCGLSNGSVVLWNIHTREEGKSFKVGQPVTTIYWLSNQVLVVMTRNTFNVYDVIIGRTKGKLPIHGDVWGMVYLEDREEYLVGAYRRIMRKESFFLTIKYTKTHEPGQQGRESLSVLSESKAINVELSTPVLVDGRIVCITPAGGVQLFDTISRSWAKGPLVFGTALSVAISSNRNFVVQTEDSIQIFPISVLASYSELYNPHWSHIYPLNEIYTLCIHQPSRRITLLESETLRENNTSILLHEARHLLREWERMDKATPLGGVSPNLTWTVTVSGSPRRRLCIKRMTRRTGFKDRQAVITTVVDRTLVDAELAMGEVYGVTFNSETNFYLKIDGPGGHAQIPYNIITSPSVHLTRGELIPLQAPCAPYTLDENCEWVLDAKSKKICWISPGDIRRGDGGHFWAGDLSLVMVGGDGVVRKLTFKDPDL